MSAALSGLDAGREALRRFLAGDDALEVMQARIVELAVDAIAGVDEASLTVFIDGQPSTPVATGSRALELDGTQYAEGDGPCLAAARHHGVELVHVRTEARWRGFCDAAERVGIVASLSAPLLDGDTCRGALNLYSESGFGADSPGVANLFADQLGVAAVNAAMYVHSVQLAQQLAEAMESRAVIEQAKGVIMATNRRGPEEAFTLLREQSQHENRKLREIAAEIVDRYTSGEESGPATRRAGR